MAEDKFGQSVIENVKNEGRDYLADCSGVNVDRLYYHWRDIFES